MHYFSIFVTDYLCVKIISPLIHCRLLPFKIRDNNDEIHKAIFMHKNRGSILFYNQLSVQNQRTNVVVHVDCCYFKSGSTSKTLHSRR